MKIRVEKLRDGKHPKTMETFHFSCSVHSPQVERFSAKIFTTEYPAHAHDGYVVGVVHHGVQEFLCKSGTHYAKAGSLIFLNPNEIHSAKAAYSSGVAYQTLQIPPLMIEKVCGANFRFKQSMIFAMPLARQLAKMLSQLDAAQGANCWLDKLAEIIDLILKVQFHLTEQLHRKYDERLSHLLKYIEANVTSRISLKTLAYQSNISPQHVIRCFKSALGVTPQDYIQARRVALAKRMLQDHDSSEVAALTGFTDQSHLTRWLKACYGVTPSLYRKKLQNGELVNLRSHGIDELLGFS